MIHRSISDKRFQMDSLDGLRGFAALIVVIAHTSHSKMYLVPFLDLRGVGKSGVFLFFLLSAFLLTLPFLQKGKEMFTFSALSHYFQRRFFRIYPLYTLYLLLAVFVTWLLTTFLGNSGVSLPSGLDWHGFFEHITLQECKGVTWSIAVEFKFYFILPIIALAIVFVRPYGMLASITFFLSLLILAQLISPQEQLINNDSSLLPYMPVFIIGMFLAYVQSHINNKTNHLKDYGVVYKYLGYVGVLGVILMTPLMFSLFGDRVESNYFHKQYILYAMFWSFVLLSAVNVNGWIQNFFTLSILRFYGALSFSLYLFHPIFIEAVKHLHMNGYLSAWSVLLGGTVLAYFSFRMFEGPISRYKVTRSSLSAILLMFKRKDL